MQTINLKDKFELFTDHWSPKIVGEINNYYVKLAKFKGELVWHSHEFEDELFLVIEGQLIIQLKDKDIYLNKDEFVIIPKGVLHRPVAFEEVHVLLLEPKTTLNTGNVDDDKLTKRILNQI